MLSLYLLSLDFSVLPWFPTSRCVNCSSPMLVTKLSNAICVPILTNRTLQRVTATWLRDTQFSTYVRSIQKGKEHLRLVRLDHIGRASIQHGGKRKNEEIFKLRSHFWSDFHEIHGFSKEVKKKVSEKLPEKFVINIDEWSDMSTCSYYLGVFACVRHDEVTECPLPTFSVLNNEVDHTAENKVKFSKDVLAIYGKSRESLAFIVSDNERTNKKLSDIFGLNKIGCFSH